jgi:uncharacterized C2H2 Zn-finger protein
MEELGRIDTERKLACPHCRKLLPDYTPGEILDESYPLRCGVCRRIVELPREYIEQVRRKHLGE